MARLTSLAFAALLICLCGISRGATDESLPYPAALAEQGQSRFVAACGFCHGRDAAGGSRGLDLIRSELVASDVNGDLIAPVVRSGRPNTDMVPFDTALLSGQDLNAIVAFIHNQRFLASTLEGGRRSVQPEDVAIGDPVAGSRYFSEHCTSCHAADRDMAGIGARMEGLPLLMRMLYPGSERGRSPRPANLSVIQSDGQQFNGPLAYQDEFTVAIRQPGGQYQSWLKNNVEFTIDDPLQAHVDQLSRYTDKDMHDVLAYLLTLNGANP